MLIDLHAHAPHPDYYDQDPYWGPAFESQPDGDIKLRPRTFVTADAQRLMTSPDLFARKFDAGEDAGIFDLLEAHLKTPAGNVYVGEAPEAPHDRVLVAA